MCAFVQGFYIPVIIKKMPVLVQTLCLSVSYICTYSRYIVYMHVFGYVFLHS